jgi:hypothetical protein
LLRCLAALGISTLLIGGAAIFFEHSFIYFPSRELIATPRNVGLEFEEVRFGPGSRLHGWFVPGAGPLTVLWFHGNGGNISHRVEWLASVRSALAANVFIFDYQGYGQSGGQPSEDNTYEDARAARAYLQARRDVDQRRIVYYGKSLGGPVAVQLATESPPYRLLLQSAFTSIADMARLHYPLLPVGRFLRTRYDSLEKIGRIQAPALVVHGEADETVPPQHARLLFEAAAEPKRLLLVEGAGHNDLVTIGGVRYLEVMREFCGTS